MKPQFPVIWKKWLSIVSKFEVRKFGCMVIILDEKITMFTWESK